MAKNLNDKKSYPHFPRPVLAHETAPVRIKRTAQYNTKISIINKDNNNLSSSDSSIKDKDQKLQVTIKTQKESACEDKSVKEVKGFQTMNVVWQVIENIRQRQFSKATQTKEVKIKKKVDIDKS
ncbi:MAG: hypothetical protein ABIK31_03950 [candidate division WOR-3 bacterium]